MNDLPGYVRGKDPEETGVISSGTVFLPDVDFTPVQQ